MFSIYHFLDFLVRCHASNLLPRRKLKNSASWTSTQTPSPGNESLTAVSWISNRSIDWLGCFCALGQVGLFGVLLGTPLAMLFSFLKVTSTCGRSRLASALRNFPRRRMSKWSELHPMESRWAQRLEPDCLCLFIYWSCCMIYVWLCSIMFVLTLVCFKLFIRRVHLFMRVRVELNLYKHSCMVTVCLVLVTFGKL